MKNIKILVFLILSISSINAANLTLNRVIPVDVDMDIFSYASDKLIVFQNKPIYSIFIYDWNGKIVKIFKMSSKTALYVWEDNFYYFDIERKNMLILDLLTKKLKRIQMLDDSIDIGKTYHVFFPYTGNMDYLILGETRNLITEGTLVVCHLLKRDRNTYRLVNLFKIPYNITGFILKDDAGIILYSTYSGENGSSIYGLTDINYGGIVVNSVFSGMPISYSLFRGFFMKVNLFYKNADNFIFSFSPADIFLKMEANSSRGFALVRFDSKEKRFLVEKVVKEIGTRWIISLPIQNYMYSKLMFTKIKPVPAFINKRSKKLIIYDYSLNPKDTIDLNNKNIQLSNLFNLLRIAPHQYLLVFLDISNLQPEPALYKVWKEGKKGNLVRIYQIDTSSGLVKKIFETLTIVGANPVIAYNEYLSVAGIKKVYVFKVGEGD